MRESKRVCFVTFGDERRGEAELLNPRNKIRVLAEEFLMRGIYRI